jgi:phosphatidylglycerophosphate synthase
MFFRHDSRSHFLPLVALAGAASDFFDGQIARWNNRTSQFGRWLDNAADIVFILIALFCETYAGIIPVYVPMLIAASFVQYVADSVLIRGSAVPVKSRLGHLGGIFNYIIVILLALGPPPRLPGIVIARSAPLIALFYVLAIGERALCYRAIAQRPVASG